MGGGPTTTFVTPIESSLFHFLRRCRSWVRWCVTPGWTWLVTGGVPGRGGGVTVGVVGGVVGVGS